jgi:hypothetical protein
MLVVEDGSQRGCPATQIPFLNDHPLVSHL